MEISAKQAAEITGLSQRRINQLISSGELPARLLGNSNAIDRKEVIKLKRRLQRKKNGTSEQNGA